METYTFYDKETGDLIQTGSSNDFGFNSTTRAITGFTAAPVSVFANFDSGVVIEKASFLDDSLQSSIYDSKESLSKLIEQPILFQTVSPCPKKPRVICPTHFYVQHDTFESLQQDISRCLVEREELVFSAFSKRQLWKCKYLEGSQSREMHIQCYWDGSKKSHCVEVKRVHGDGLFPHHADLVTVLKQGLGVSCQKSAICRKIPVIPPAAFSSTKRVDAPEDSFRESIQFLIDMSKSSYFESRLESAKMLCDVISKQSCCVLEASNIQCDVLDTINAFLQDQNDAVIEFGVVATHLLLEKSVAYRSSMIEYNSGSIMVALIAQIRNAEYNVETGEDNFYQYAQMRRLAGKSLQLLVSDVCSRCCNATDSSSASISNDPARSTQRRCFMSRILQQAGFFSRENWLEYMLQLKDCQLREIVVAVAECY
mmetsp:Transcript_20480/g.15105  ORF Transcript_20480/g.15105 Transcript_20480/m.15105 type:complete len:426 (-) Transcript_20480:445-1722(-)|eukprot:CAMPEP_0202961558 /NCGR_PEP_ID=MMETSP1396-20130829/5612_1 /ASSEMBLY_ACC=CAM_ASM_000872 /TAXON_ID= /ORGANISM="Pseudokeronopsis sp., Strain Brazil" /LENGTH=425 /DNA_ID=CAMNT_0049681463 /DNA_START=162 /DNA_END=1439 /DNA_ORIENTATION=-